MLHSLSDLFVPIRMSGIFVPTTNTVDPNDDTIVTLHDCWPCAWAGSSSDDEPVLDVGELAHYTRLPFSRR